MAFSITPVPAAPSPAEFPEFIQFQQDGEDLGGPNVKVIDFVFDPTEFQVTRGYGEDYNKLTVRRIAESPPPAPPVIGWLDPLGNAEGVANRANSGTAQPSTQTFPEEYYAGVVGYTSGVVVWSSTWAPTSGGPAPVLDVPVFAPPGVVRVTWPRQGFDFWEPTQGLLTLTATVDGVSVGVGEGLVMSAAGTYTTTAWGPEP